jgi:Tfp pilus assembly protein PilZ
MRNRYQSVFDMIINYPDLLYTLVLSSAAIAVGVGVFIVSRWGFGLFIGYSFWSIFSWIYLFVRLPDILTVFKVLGIIAILVTVGVILFFLRKSILSPFFNPSLRWWKTPPRFLVKDLKTPVGSKLNNQSFEIFDINVNGCYLIGDELLKGLKAGDLFNFQITHDQDKIDLEGEVVWLNPPEVNGFKPSGLGLKFVHLTPEARKNLNKLLQVLKEESRLSR